MLEKLKICQHNSARSREVLQSCFEIALKEEAGILLIQEPYLYYNRSTQQYCHISHPSYHAILPVVDTFIRPRVITYVNRSLSIDISLRSDLSMDHDYQIFEMSTAEEDFYIFHIYNERPLMESETRYTIQRFFEQLFNIEKPFLLIGDLNLHHHRWNPTITHTCQLAEKFVDFLDLTQSELLIDYDMVEEYGGTFHRANTQSTSIIDLAFASKFKRLRWTNWRYTEATGSDHEAIIIETHLTSNLSPINQLPPRYNLRKANGRNSNNNSEPLKKSHETMQLRSSTTRAKKNLRIKSLFYYKSTLQMLHTAPFLS